MSLVTILNLCTLINSFAAWLPSFLFSRTGNFSNCHYHYPPCLLMVFDLVLLMIILHIPPRKEPTCNSAVEPCVKYFTPYWLCATADGKFTEEEGDETQKDVEDVFYTTVRFHPEARLALDTVQSPLPRKWRFCWFLVLYRNSTTFPLYYSIQTTMTIPT